MMNTLQQQEQQLIDVFMVCDSSYFARYFQYQTICSDLLKKAKKKDPTASYATIRGQALQRLKAEAIQF